MIQCDKCLGLFNSNSWEREVTYKGIDEHHNPPKFITKILQEIWVGEFYNLYRKCHRILHDKILEILNNNACSFKFIKSEHWIMKKMNLNQIRKSKEEIYKFTLEWIKGDDDTKTTM